MAKTLLVADDSATMRRAVEMTFAAEDVQLVTAPSGEAALQKAREVRPDVVLADAVMGAMSGYELCRAIKADPGLRAIPVIVMASQHAPYDEALGRDVGADDHCLKPFDSQAIIDKVKTMAARSSTVRVPVAPAPVARAPAAPAPLAAAVTGAGALTPPPSIGQAPSRPMAPPAPPAPPARAPVAAAPAPPPRPAPAPTPPAHAPAPAPAAFVMEATDAAIGHAMSKAGSLGLTADQATAIAKLTREVVERVVWEVVPDLAETIVREELRRLTRA